MLTLLLLATSATRAVEGNQQSQVRVIIYEDLQCSDCANFRRMLDDQLLPRYGGRVAFEHRDFPLAKHSWARKAAVAGRFFDSIKVETGVAWRRHILSSIRDTTPDNIASRISDFAKRHGVDASRAIAALEDPALAALVEKDYQEGVARGIAKTPTVLAGGVVLIETFTFDEISRAIDAELAR